MEIKVEYDGSWPNLCAGTLKVTIDGKTWDFGKYCLISGGEITHEENGEPEVIKGEWSIREWPVNFPEEYKKETLEEINCSIPWGCCGGCF